MLIGTSKVENGGQSQGNNTSAQNTDYALIGTNRPGATAECQSEADEENNQGADQDMIEFNFKIEGMTCVACSNSIERLMHN